MDEQPEFCFPEPLQTGMTGVADSRFVPHIGHVLCARRYLDKQAGK